MKVSKDLVPYLNIKASRRTPPADFAAPDQDLKESLGGSAFPFCAFLDPEGAVLWEGRPGSEAAFKRHLASARLVQELGRRARKTPDDQAVRAGLNLLISLGSRQRKGLGAKAEAQLAATPGLDPRVKERYEKKLFELEVLKILRSGGRDENRLAQTIYGLRKSGKRLPDDSRFALAYRYYALRGALDTAHLEHAEAYMKAFKRLAKKAPAPIQERLEGDRRQLKIDLQALREARDPNKALGAPPRSEKGP